MIRERSINPKPIMPKFIVDSMNDLVKDEDETKFVSDKIHTLTCKEQNNKIAPNNLKAPRKIRWHETKTNRRSWTKLFCSIKTLNRTRNVQR